MTKTKRGTTKHTPGPWAIWTSCSYRRIGSEATGREVAYPTTQRDGHPDIEFPNGGADGPDARLIAAAPELLEELKSLCDRFVKAAVLAGTDKEFAEIAVKETRQLIAKAEGQ